MKTVRIWVLVGLFFSYSFYTHDSNHNRSIKIYADYCQQYCGGYDIVQPVKNIQKLIENKADLKLVIEYVESETCSVFYKNNQELYNISENFHVWQYAFADLKKELASLLYRYTSSWYKMYLYEQLCNLHKLEGYCDHVTEEQRVSLVSRLYQELGVAWRVEQLLSENHSFDSGIDCICQTYFLPDQSFSEKSDEFLQAVYFLKIVDGMHKNYRDEYEYCKRYFNVWNNCKKVMVAGVLVVLYSYRLELKERAFDGLYLSSEVYDNHIKDPLCKAYNSLQKNIKTPKLDLTKQQEKFEALIARELQESEPIGDNMSLMGAALQQGANFTGIDDLLGSGMESIGLKSKPQQKREYESFEKAKEDVLTHDTIVFAHPEKNIEKLPRAVLRSLLDIILDGGQEINIVLEDMYATNHKIISLAACIPVATILAGAYFFAKKGYAHSIYQPICTIIRDLNLLLNRSLDKNNDRYIDGLVYFYAMQLSDCALLVPKKTALQLDEDIKDLKSLSLNYQQKYNVILRMYHTYDFLLPGAV